MRRLLILGLASTTLLAAGCGADSTVQPAASGASPTAVTVAKPTARPIAVAKYPAACTAIVLGKTNNWSAAETHWLSAENAASNDSSATLAFFQLLADTGALALDALGGTSSTTAMATYKTDMAAAGSFTTGC